MGWTVGITKYNKNNLETIVLVQAYPASLYQTRDTLAVTDHLLKRETGVLQVKSNGPGTNGNILIIRHG